jgi:hypothetical protein
MLFAALLVASLMVVLTVAIHFFGVTVLLRLLRRRTSPHAADPLHRQAVLALIVVLGLIALHGLEVWAYAALYLVLGEFRTLEEALYFSAVSFSTAGFGDVVMTSRWRVISAVESINGFVLIGWSTAMLVTVTARMRRAEEHHDVG